MYSLAYELGVLDIQQVLDLPLEVYRGWIVWFHKRNKENERRRR